MASGGSQPFSSCATASAAITADCFWSGGYLASSRSIPRSAASLSIAETPVRRRGPSLSPIYLPEHDVERTDDRDGVGDHVAARHLVERREVDETRRAQLDPVRLVRAVGDDVDAELALRVLDRRIRLARRHVHPLGEELEVMDEIL